MDIRKIAVAAGFACGATLAFAPLAQADLGDTVSSTLAGEVGIQNSLFETYAALGGVTDVVKGGAAGVYDHLGDLSKDAPQLFPGTSTLGEVTPLESYIYGTNPILAGISDTTGPYNEFNGALTQFYDAYNVYAFAAANNGALDTNVGDYLGSTSTITHALDTGSIAGAAQYFYNFGLGDLNGFDANFAPSATADGGILPTISGEITSLNSMFEFDGRLADVYNDIVPNINSVPGIYTGFDTIDPTKVTDSFESLVFGAAGASGDPGSYDVLNGALTEFFNADNVGLFSLLNGGDLISPDLIFGTHDLVSGATDTVASAISGYLQLGLSDLVGYFLPAMTG
ncbi:hypothetical protein PT015_08325 [Candidatus Mycobacterium wuenschmannii]|uniref:PE-PGRS family protein n=1 Tax=Candidatus Mycobacterium wuenschmannii TaxID=3027808 RepID=A0ABY8W0K7_9MYCO|nr:hypothetical protein [Candidatus Mycobacterium wuenschmannii]WIM89430.1 hypothetical protein PT015_08325 [Candidatus Mycobacterium wuenschmannii]